MSSPLYQNAISLIVSCKILYCVTNMTVRIVYFTFKAVIIIGSRLAECCMMIDYKHTYKFCSPRVFIAWYLIN
jgi:hypothetical protein